MATPMIRQPVVAGRFYASSPSACRADCQQLFAEASAGLDAAPAGRLPGRIVGGIVPHAGWVFSGEPAARTLEAIGRTGSPKTFVLFGAMHQGRSRAALLFGPGAWQTPLGEAAIDEELSARLGGASPHIVIEPQGHAREHSLEVQVPLIQYRFPEARIVPILVPPTQWAAEVGRAIGAVLSAAGGEVAVLGSTDLTHYGPGYGFQANGAGPEGLRWARQVNDAALIELVEQLAADRVVEQTNQRGNACGGGAVAATLAVARQRGATRGVVLEHVTSQDVLARHGQHSDDAVGYLSAVLG